jgi:hypothetical protein
MQALNVSLWRRPLPLLSSQAELENACTNTSVWIVESLINIAKRRSFSVRTRSSGKRFTRAYLWPSRQN